MSKQLTFLDYGVAATQEEFLKESIINRKNIIITGNKNSGKTSFLNVCLNELNNKDLRVVTIDYKNELIYNALYVHHSDVSPYVLPDIHKNDNTMICANQQVFLLSTVEATKHLGYLQEQEHLPIPEK